MKKSIKAILLAVLLVVAVSTAAQTMYTITDLGTLGGNTSNGTAISNSGLVAGYSYLQDNATIHAFLYSNGGLTDIGTLSGTSVSFAYGVNDAGQVTGESYTMPANRHAFLYSNGTMTDIGTLGGSDASGRGINALGQITGQDFLLDSVQNLQAFLYSNGTMTDIGTPDERSFGNAINDAGEITGASSFNHGNGQAFLYSNGVMTDLGAAGAIGATDSVGTTINASRQIAGWFSITLANGSGLQHTFLYSNGTITDLGTLGGSFSAAFGINAWGQITGQSSLLPGDINEHAFVYSSNGTMKDLNDLLPSGSGWVLATASAINDAGQITGGGLNPSGVGRAFLLTPIYTAFVQQPINADGSSVFNASRGVIPVKFTLTQNGTQTCALPPATISVTRTAGGKLGPIGEASYVSPPDNGSNFRIDTTACQYVYNLAASGLGVGTYRVDISINGIFVGHVMFALN